MNVTRTLASLCVAAALSAPVLAADDHKGHAHDGKKADHPHDASAKHGGVVSVLKDVNYELVAKPDSLALYVLDHGKPVDLKNASAKVTLLSASDKGEFTLAPAGDKLEAKGSFKVSAGTKAVAVVSSDGKPLGTARFTLK